MVSQYQKIADQGGAGKEEQTAEHQAGAGKDSACRCKEAAEMTPRKLFGLMISDLAFWKKAKKG